MSVRETCAEWQRGIEPHDDPALKGKKDPDQGYDIKVIKTGMTISISREAQKIMDSNKSYLENKYSVFINQE